MLTRREAGRMIAGAMASTTLLVAGVRAARAAAEKEIKVGINLPLTGADAERASRIKYGALLAIQLANDPNAVPGHEFVPWVLNDATSTAGQYDPAQAATNARNFISDPHVMAAIGPQMGVSGRRVGSW